MAVTSKLNTRFIKNFSIFKVAPIKFPKDWWEAYVITLLAISILGFLSVKGSTNTCLFLLLIPALIELSNSYLNLRAGDTLKLANSIILALSLPIAAIFVSQLLRQNWLFKPFDAPSRPLLSILIFFYLTYKKIDYANLLKICAPLSLLIMMPVVHAHPEIIARWSDRFATTFVDPNAFGTYALALTAICLFSLDLGELKNWRQILLVAGMFAGFYLVAGSKTRGSWFSIPPLLLLWLSLKFNSINWRLTVPIGLAVLILLILGSPLFPELIDRLISGFRELKGWLDGSDTETSAGARLTMWKMSWALFVHNPLVGYGDLGIRDYLDASWVSSISTPIGKESIYNGPHNELLANLLRSGILGGISTLCFFLLPLKLFWRFKSDPAQSLACLQGIALIVSLMFCSISIEVFTLKYTVSFYALAIASLSAQIVHANLTSTQSSSQKNL